MDAYVPVMSAQPDRPEVDEKTYWGNAPCGIYTHSRELSRPIVEHFFEDIDHR